MIYQIEIYYQFIPLSNYLRPKFRPPALNMGAKVTIAQISYVL